MERESSSMRALAVGAVGVVFGDLGTSPLYTLQEVFSRDYGLEINHASVLGALSLVFWALVLVVCLKYVLLVMRADNQGEGGIMALLALAQHSVGNSHKWRAAIAWLGIFGAALFYGDGVITPAISVLSAVEGIQVVNPALTDWILPISVVILLALFAMQRFGTERVSKLFAPIMCLWFIAIALLGVVMIVREPEVLRALNPFYAVRFFQVHGLAGFVALGGVVLALTGAEALYADMGHFGKRPIRMAWISFVFPALLLNYFGQGAFLLSNPKAEGNLFYLIVPHALLVPMIVLAAAATVIASQAVISGAYSMTRDAMRLGYWPRMLIVHTSSRVAGQVFVPQVNAVLLILVLAAVLGFRSSENLGAAYGIAVTGTMISTTLLLLVVAARLWHWKPVLVVALGAVLLVIDGAFFGANLIKVEHGGWFPLALGLLVLAVMATWHRGRRILLSQMKDEARPLIPFLTALAEHPPVRLPGTAIFLSSNLEVVPPALWLSVTRFSALHERNVLVHVETLEVPFVDTVHCAEWRQLDHSFWVVALRYGFMQTPDIPAALPRAAPHGVMVDGPQATFFLTSEAVWVSRRYGMGLWRDRLFTFLARNTRPAPAFFEIPGDRVVELGQPVEL
jgi:KUP system potassium uptake protein